MTEISNMELVQKMMKSMVVLKEKAFGGQRPRMGRKFGFSGRGFAGPDVASGQPFGQDGWSTMGSGQPGRWSMDDGRPNMMDQRFKMMGGRSGMMAARKVFRGRPGLVRERLLTIIADAPDGIRAKDVAKQAGINQSSVSESLSKLEDDGYIKRTTDPADKRATLIFLTDLGQARANEIEDQQQEMFGHLFDNLTADEKAELARLLDKIINN